MVSIAEDTRNLKVAPLKWGDYQYTRNAIENLIEIKGNFKLGELDEVNKMIDQSCLITHDDFNKRYEDYGFDMQGNLVLGVYKF